MREHGGGLQIAVREAARTYVVHRQDEVAVVGKAILRQLAETRSCQLVDFDITVVEEMLERTFLPLATGGICDSDLRLVTQSP